MSPQEPVCWLLLDIDYRSVSPYGVAYAVAKVMDPAGKTHKALACSRRFGDLDQLDPLKGSMVWLFRARNGLQLMPAVVQGRPIRDWLHSCAGPSGKREEMHSQWEDSESPFFPPEEGDLDYGESIQSGSMADLQELASTVAKLARDLKIPTAMWVHFP